MMAYAPDETTAAQEQTPLPALYPAPVFATLAREVDFGVVRKPARKCVPFKVANIGGKGILRVQLSPSPDQGWFQIHPAKLQIPAGEDRVVEAEIDTGHPACPEGRQTLAIEVDAPESIVPAAPRVPVLVEVLEEIRLIAEPAALDLGVLPQGECRTVTVMLRRSDGLAADLVPGAEVTDGEGTPRPAWAEVRAERPGRQQTVTLSFHTANRTQQEYRCRIRLSDSAAEVSPVEIALRAQVGPPPLLEIGLPAPMPLFPGGLREASLTLRNAGGGVLRGRIASDQSWLQVRAGEFEVPPGASAAVPVSLGHAKLTPGMHTANLEIECNEGGRARTRRVPFPLAVEDETKCSPIEVEFDGNAGEVLAGRGIELVMTLRNRMGQPFEGSLKSGSPEWLVAPEQAITLGPGETGQARLRVETGALAPEKEYRDYAAWVRVMSGWKVCWNGRVTLRVLPRRRPRFLLPTIAAAVVLPAGLLLGPAIQGWVVPHGSGASGQSPAAPTTAATAPGKDPEKARLSYVNGQVAYAHQEWRQAAKWFADAARYDPSPAGCYVQIGRSLYQAGDFDGAEKALHRALELKPDSPEARDWLKRVGKERGR